MIASPECLTAHEMRAQPSRSFRFAKPRTSAYSFVLTWLPGKLMLTGDIGDLTLTHGYACGKFDHAIRWAADSEFDYLMGKTGIHQTYDVYATRTALIQMANEPVISSLRDHQQDLRVWRRAVASGDADLSDRPTDEDPRIMSKRDDYERIARRWFDHTSLYEMRDMFHFDPCWDLWFSIWKVIYEVHEPPAAHSLTPGPQAILTRSGREMMALSMADRLSDAISAAQFCSDIGLDDYGGEYVWTDQPRRQIDAIRHGCRMLIADGHIDMTGDVP